MPDTQHLEARARQILRADAHRRVNILSGDHIARMHDEQNLVNIGTAVSAMLTYAASEPTHEERVAYEGKILALEITLNRLMSRLGANAGVRAAAPELLSACQGMVELLSGKPMSGIEGEQRLQAAVDAIATATIPCLANQHRGGSVSFECAAAKQGTAGGHDPVSCDYPECGCDPDYVEPASEQPDTYRGWSISFDYPPIPCRDFDWSGTHPDYDGADDANDSRAVHGHTREAVIAAIDAWFEEQAA